MRKKLIVVLAIVLCAALVAGVLAYTVFMSVNLNYTSGVQAIGSINIYQVATTTVYDPNSAFPSVNTIGAETTSFDVWNSGNQPVQLLLTMTNFNPVNTWDTTVASTTGTIYFDGNPAIGGGAIFSYSFTVGGTSYTWNNPTLTLQPLQRTTIVLTQNCYSLVQAGNVGFTVTVNAESNS